MYVEVQLTFIIFNIVKSAFSFLLVYTIKNENRQYCFRVSICEALQTHLTYNFMRLLDESERSRFLYSSRL